MKDFYPGIQLIGDMDTIVLVDGYAGGKIQVAWGETQASHIKKKIAFLVEDLEITESRVRYIDMVIRIKGNAFRIRKKSGPVPYGSEGTHVFSFGIENLHPEIAGVENVQVAAPVQGNAERCIELPLVGPAGPELEERISVQGQHNNFVAGPVEDVKPAESIVDGETNGLCVNERICRPITGVGIKDGDFCLSRIGHINSARCIGDNRGRGMYRSFMTEYMQIFLYPVKNKYLPQYDIRCVNPVVADKYAIGPAHRIDVGFAEKQFSEGIDMAYIVFRIN